MVKEVIVMPQETKEDYSYRSMELIGEINCVIGKLQSKLSIICLSPDDTGVTESEACELNNDLGLVLLSLESLNRRLAL